jgi:hypothetical protein
MRMCLDNFGLLAPVGCLFPQECAFALQRCTLWYVNALAAVGRREEAGEIFEPQTYSIVGMIISAMRVSRTWEEAFWRG